MLRVFGTLRALFALLLRRARVQGVFVRAARKGIPSLHFVRRRFRKFELARVCGAVVAALIMPINQNEFV